MLKEALATARDELVSQTRLAHGGLLAVRRYSARLDEIIGRIHLAAREHTETPYALVAVGGYGRRHMCLHSDVDLLMVFDGAIGTADERAVKAVLHPLWDLRLDVGHQVRELGDTSTVDPDNPEYLIALRDARFVAGDETVFGRFSDMCIREGAALEAPTLAALRDLVRQRHTQFQHTLYHLEPDVKDAPGALRDVSAIRLIVDLDRQAQPIEFRAGRVREAEDFMMRIRSILHLERGRNLNVLTHELQEIVASTFGSPGEEPSTQVEALMSTYFHHARIISRGLAASVKKRRQAPPQGPTPAGDGLVCRDREISFLDGTRASLQPHLWLGAFEAALDHDRDVSDQVLTCIERHGDRYPPERFFPGEGERDRLLRVLRPRPGLYARLSEMHASGLLGRMFPEFQRVYCHVIRDFYHKYTVDEHTLLTIRNLERLSEPKTPSRRRFGNIFAELDRPELLVIALVFHDVGKWTNKNHCEEGVRMAGPALRRIRMSEPDISNVTFLIRHHLQMSTAAFRRDSGDPEVVEQLARLVGTEQRLKQLCLMTLVDVEAVGPDVMTPWKEDLLWRLYVDTYNRLTLGYGDDVIDPAATSLEALIETLPSDVAQTDLDAFLEGLPRRYLRTVDAAHVYAHVRLGRDLGPSDVHCALDRTDAVWELTVVSVDQPKLYAKVCGVLSYFGMDILRGQAMSNMHGVALDVFQFTDAEQFLTQNASAEDELIHRLQEVVAGREDIDRTLAPKQEGLARHRPAHVRVVVHVDNQYSDRFSIIEIIAPNAWGLLYRISRVISDHDCNIDLVLISTEGDRAIDVFHLTKNGAKLTGAEADSLRDALLVALAPTDAS